MKKMIASTSIHAPTKAYHEYLEKHPEWELVVAGDLKTPPLTYRLLEKNYKNLTYLDLDDQKKLAPRLHELVGFNTIERRNFSILYCYLQGADIIALIDDDNIPLENWGKEENLFVNRTVSLPNYVSKEGILDPVYVSNRKPVVNVWHRGFPLQLLNKRNFVKEDNIEDQEFLVQADMWEGEPDVDAIQRFTRREWEEVFPYNPNVFPFCTTDFAPFNSQNTFLSRKIVPHFFLFPELGRMADIWAAYYICAKKLTPIVYGAPSVYQVRNEHDLTSDFEMEILGITHTLHLIESLRADPENYFNYLSYRSRKSYEEYLKVVL